MCTIWPGIRGTHLVSSVRMKKTRESSNMLFLGNLIPEIESKAPTLVTSHSNESALNFIGGLFLLEPLHPRYLGWMILSECHESPAALHHSILNSANLFVSMNVQG